MTPMATTTFGNALEIVTRQLARHVSKEVRPVCYLPGNAGRIDAVERWIFEQPERLRGVDVFQVLALGPARGWRAERLGPPARIRRSSPADRA